LSFPYIARQIVSPQSKLHFEERVAIVTDNAAQRRRLCKFVAGGPAPNAQRRASAFQLRPAADARPIRLVNEAAGGKIGSVLASAISATQANLFLPEQVLD
jgi:hypothetical protein